jgi:hypothetical protein
MTDIPDHVVIPYSRFLEMLERRRTFGDDPRPQPPKTGADLPPVPQQPPAPVATAWRTP